MEKKNILVFIILIVAVLSIILLINYIKANGNISGGVIKCIAKNSKVIVSKTCSACAYQKQILGEYLKDFEIIDITEHPEVMEQYDIDRVPTWIINGEKYAGVQSIEKLKELAGC